MGKRSNFERREADFPTCARDTDDNHPRRPDAGTRKEAMR